MSQVPEIKPEMTGKEEEKKRSGFIVSFLERLGGGASATGGAGAAGGAAAGGGLLATKAGIIGLALIGTTVAGGIGVVGYKIMAPASQASNTFSIFDARPKSAVAEGDGSEASAASKDGTSDSLNMFAKANTGGSEEGKPAEDASKSESASSDKSQASASASAAVDHGNVQMSGPAAKVPKASLSGKIGSLGSASGGGSGSSASSMGSSLATGGVGRGRMSGFGGSGAASGARGGVSRAMVRSGSSYRSAQNARNDGRRFGGSMAGAGRTFDGNANRTASFGPESTGVSEGGAGVGGRAPTGDNSPGANNAPPDQEQDPPLPKNMKEITPWSDILEKAKMALYTAAGLIFCAGLLAKEAKCTGGEANPASAPFSAMARFLAFMGGMAALAAITMAAMVMREPHGQYAIGSCFIVAGGLMTAAAGGILFSGTSTEKDQVLGQVPDWITYCGAGGIIAGVIAPMLVKPRTFNCPEGNDEGSFTEPADFDNCEEAMLTHPAGGAPSDHVLDQFLA